jgi:hypothetical protein
MSRRRNPSSTPDSPLTRRNFLAAGGASALGIVAAAGVTAVEGGLNPFDATPAGALPLAPSYQFQTEPELDPPLLQFTDLGVPQDEGLFFLVPTILPTLITLTPLKAVIDHMGQQGLMIVDAKGNLVYFRYLANFATNLEVQTYKGQPVLTWWEGTEVNGIGSGKGYIYSDRYEQVAVIKGSGAVPPDLHEFTITTRDTVLVSAYKQKKVDLTAVGGPSNAMVWGSMIEEIDPDTGDVVFSWNSLDHVPITDSYVVYAPGVYDYFHINSICEWDDQSYLVSGRNVCAIYNVDRTTGAINWQIGGKNPTMSMGTGTTFWYQHHARRVPSGQISLFDDGGAPPKETMSRGLVLNVDTSTKTVALAQAVTHPSKLLAFFEGSMQVLPSGNMVVGYGSEPNVAEFDASGNLLLDIRFPTNVQSYRAERFPWSATPKANPKISVTVDGTAGYAVYLSWNGATEVASWRVLSGTSATSLSTLVTMPKAGFETAITVRSSGTFVQGEALNSSGQVIGKTKVLNVT